MAKREISKIDLFLTLLKAGLWEEDIQLSQSDVIDFKEIYRLAREQSVVGLVAAGIEHVIGVQFSKEDLLSIVGESLQLEQRNAAMNHFIGVIVEKMREAGIYTLLLKGQGIAQCYVKPQWRACGDVDFFLSATNFFHALDFLRPLTTRIDEVDEYKLHQPLIIDPWMVELHGTLRSGLWRKLDSELDIIQEEIFYSGAVRSWMNGNTQVFLPRADEDVIFVFSHILQHFFRGGIGLRQICDWCRLLWTYKRDIDINLLESRIRKMGVMTEWKAFASLAINYLGMPEEAMPFYSNSVCWKHKAKRILDMVIETGNFGQNRDLSYQNKSFVIRKSITLSRLTWDSIRQIMIFPIDPIKVWNNMFVQRISLLFNKNRI